MCVLVGADRLPGVPGDAQDHDGDGEADERVGDRRAEGDDDGAEHDAEADQRVAAGVVACPCGAGTVLAPAGIWLAVLGPEAAGTGVAGTLPSSTEPELAGRTLCVK